MRKLVYENKKAISKHELFANQLVNSLNEVLSRFTASHNHFSQPIDEAFAFGLVSDPVGTFDGLLRANSPIKPIGGKQLDIEKLSELTGIDRQAFIESFTVVLPGSVDEFNKHGQTGILTLKSKNKTLVRFENGKFALNYEQLAKDLEQYRVYAENKDQTELLTYWDNLKNTLNKHLEKKYIKESEVNFIASKLGLVVNSQTVSIGQYKYSFDIDYKGLSSEIIALAAN